MNPTGAQGHQHYLLSLYMAWAGVSAMGYGSIVLVAKREILFAVFVGVVQIVRAPHGARACAAVAARARGARALARRPPF